MQSYPWLAGLFITLVFVLFILGGASLPSLGVHHVNFHTPFKTQFKWHFLREVSLDFSFVIPAHLSLTWGPYRVYLELGLLTAETPWAMFSSEGRNWVLFSSRNPHCAKLRIESLLQLHLAAELSGSSSNSPLGYRYICPPKAERDMFPRAH